MSLDDFTGLIERIDNLLRKWPLFRVLAVLLQLYGAASTEDDTIARVEYRMMLAPPQRDLGQTQVVFILERWRSSIHHCD